MPAELARVSTVKRLATKFVTPSTVTAASFWGATAVGTALWLVQPFDWIKEQLGMKAE